MPSRSERASRGQGVDMVDGAIRKVAVLGAGAVGCFYGGLLARSGVPVTLIGRATHVEAIRRDGLVIEWADRRETIRVDASTDVAAVRDADLVLVCVKSPDTSDAGRSLRPHLRPDAVVASLQNGVDNADRLRAVLSQPVLAAVVYVGAYMDGPGIVRHTGRGDLVLGAARADRERPGIAENLAAVAALFEAAGIACPLSEDIDAALWTKLVINCAFNAISALGRARYGRMVREPGIRALMEGTVRESVAVARAAGVALDERKLLAAVWGVADALAQQYSSTAQDILRGKRTEIDALNGFVAERAAALGVDTPINRTLHALVRLREAGDDLA
jgi:2-dehydropantoate 2-reductase